MTSLPFSSLVVFLLLTLASTAWAVTGPKVRRALLAAPAPAPGPFSLGALLPNSDPSCDPRWAYETGCYSDYSCAKGHICTCKNGDKCGDGNYFGIFLCPCDEAPQIPSPPPPPRTPPPPPLICRKPASSKCLVAFNQTDAIAKCNATGGNITFTPPVYTCTCCKGSPSFSATPPTPRPPPPPPPRVPDFDKHIRTHVFTIIAGTWGGIAGLIIACVTCFCCVKRQKKAKAAAQATDLEQPRIKRRARRARKGTKTTNGKQWFEPGYHGPGFQTTKAGLVVSRSLPKNECFVELVASFFDEAGPSGTADDEEATAWSADEEGGDDGKRGIGAGASSRTEGLKSDIMRTGKGKEPEISAPDSPAPASIDGLPEDEICIVCCNAPKECVFVPCGHHATCMACGHLVQQQGGKGCPVCRKPIERVLRIYEA